MSLNKESTYLELIKENLGEIRHTENHRNNITGVILVIVAALVAVVSDDDKGLYELPVALIIITLGVFGMFVTRKLYERQKWYAGRVEFLYDELEKQVDGLNIKEIYSRHEEYHKEKFKFFSKVRMNSLWTLIHLFVIIIGIVLIVK